MTDAPEANRTPDDGSDDPRVDDVDESAVVDAAAESAIDLIYSRYDRSAVDDLDVTVEFTDGDLSIDVGFEPPDGAADPERVASDAVRAAEAAADRVLRERDD